MDGLFILIPFYYNQFMKKILSPAFFDRPTTTVARGLLGMWIVSKGGDRELMITEVEAYDGPRDRASHANRGRTARTDVMFGPPGVFYIYFVYGMHWMVNVVTGPAGYPAAVLLRAGVWRDPETGDWVRVDGPGRLARFLGVSGVMNRLPARRRSGIWFEDRGTRIPRGAIVASKRIGVDYAGPVWSNKYYNFRAKTVPAPKASSVSKGRRKDYRSQI